MFLTCKIKIDACKYDCGWKYANAAILQVPMFYFQVRLTVYYAVGQGWQEYMI